MAGITVSNLRDDLSFGARVRGVNWETLADPAVRAQLNAVFEDRGMIVFEDVEQTGKMQVAISEVFGPLKDHPTANVTRDDPDLAPGVIDMHSMPQAPDDDQGVVVKNGKRLVRYSPWHFDHCYNDELNRAGVLRSPVIAGEGGRTGFCDGLEMYELLSPDLRDRIDGLNILYTLDVRLSTMRYGVDFQLLRDPDEALKFVAEAGTFPRAVHPAVWERDGRKVLHVGSWMAVGVENHEDAEGDKLLDDVCQEINQKARAYWHQWKPGDMLIWDNWRMLHAVEGNDARYERRTLRSTIKGDYGLGYFEGGKKIGEVQREVA